MTPQQIQAMKEAIATALAANPDVKLYGGKNDPNSILDAYMTGDWSNVVSLTGKPFTDEQQQAAVAQAETALAPAYKAQVAKDTADTESSLRSNQEGFGEWQNNEQRSFAQDKLAADQDAADKGVLFSGARVQKMNDIRNTYADREAQQRRIAAENAASTGRSFQYNYGNEAAKGLSQYYALPGASNFDATRGTVSRGGLSSTYDPSKYDFQGTAPVAQKAAIQTRAASYLANRANKLSLSGIGSKL
jgi:hypothetical protein